ncbi:MAG: arginine--tRNA ligase [Candidatus Riflebacteria bacterium]|nr:arginine--tRNA ligase [Candidatus Riflebacteria bacterium]
MRKALAELIHARLAPLVAEFVPNPRDFFELQTTPDPAKGDFALNAAMKLAKPARTRPLDLAQKMVAALAAETAWFTKVEAVPPGFINLFLTDEAITRELGRFAEDAEMGLRRDGRPETVVVDYSSVNIAKQMHVGHLRSTIIGDVLARVLSARGDRVIRQNHLGDWGLPMAMVLWKATPLLRDLEAKGLDPARELSLAQLETLYREATRACEAQPEAAAACHDILVRLQNGDAVLLQDWRTITRLSMREVYRLYEELGVLLTQEDEAGESHYRDSLADTVRQIRESGHLVESRGAQCVFLEHFKAKDGSPLPVIVQKSDGGFNYETFDLAAILYRIHALKASRLIYVTDARQALHFAQVFDVAHVCGWTKDPGRPVTLEHVPFGSVLGEDNKPLKTRSGENVKLADLLAEAVERARAVVEEKNPDLPEETKRQVARMVGIGAIKYADLSQNRNNDYVFSFPRMLALQGNTAPYLQYAHARICSIFRKAGLPADGAFGPPRLGHPAERALALKLQELPTAVAAVAAELRPHTLCNYLYELATQFTSFYDQCPVLTCEDPARKQARFFLCRLTQRVLARGLDLLGIDAPREM